MELYKCFCICARSHSRTDEIPDYLIYGAKGPKGPRGDSGDTYSLVYYREASEFPHVRHGNNGLTQKPTIHI